MSEEPPRQLPAVTVERRLMIRYPSLARALVVRETDMMRCGFDATLRNLSAGGLGLRLRVPLDPGEQVKVVVRNQIQRIEKEVRGIVRHVTPDGEDFLVGVELCSRLTPLEVGLLRMGLPTDPHGSGPTWV